MSRLPRDPDCELDYSDYFAARQYATDAEMDAAADPDDGWTLDPETGTWSPDHDCPAANDGEPCWCAEGRHLQTTNKETA